MRVIQTARKHGVGDEDLLHAVRHGIRLIRPRGEEGFVMVLGPDRTGRLLEVGVAGFGTDDEVVIHGMEMRRKWRVYLP